MPSAYIGHLVVCGCEIPRLSFAIASCMLIARSYAPFATITTSFDPIPHAPPIGSILRDLSRIRAELAGKFLRAIRQGHYLWNSQRTLLRIHKAAVPIQPLRRISSIRRSPRAISQRWWPAIKAAGLTDTLTGKGPFTVFAPTDEAFKKLPAGALDALLKDTAKLKAVLNYHVVTGHVLAKDMKAGEVMTVQGSPLTAVVSSSGVQVNGARVKQADITATNGVIHAIDAVIMPKNWQLLAAAADDRLRRRAFR